jgi:hypothetical protein
MSDAITQPLSPERSIYLRQSAFQALQVLEQFSGSAVEYGATALQLLDEWIDRIERRGPLSETERMLAIACLGQTFIHRHGGYWATRAQAQRQSLGVVCPVPGGGEEVRFINVVEQVNLRLSQGISSSLTFFYLTTSVDLGLS